MRKIILIICLTFFSAFAYCPELPFFEISQIIQESCIKYKYSVPKVMALFFCESEFKPTKTYCHKTSEYAYGVGQILYSTAIDYPLYYKGRKQDLILPSVSIPLCIRYMVYLEKVYHGNFEMVLAHYSGYIGHKNRSKNYKRVMKYYTRSLKNEKLYALAQKHIYTQGITKSLLDNR